MAPKINGVDISLISKINGITKANISKYNGITGVTINPLDNTVKISTPCNTLSDANVKVDLTITYDISLGACLMLAGNGADRLT